MRIGVFLALTNKLSFYFLVFMYIFLKFHLRFLTFFHFAKYKYDLTHFQ